MEARTPGSSSAPLWLQAETPRSGTQGYFWPAFLAPGLREGLGSSWRTGLGGRGRQIPGFGKKGGARGAGLPEAQNREGLWGPFLGRLWGPETE